MRLYRNSYRRADADEHTGYSFHTSKESAAKRAAASKPHSTVETEAIEVETTKHGLIKALNLYAGHPDNG